MFVESIKMEEPCGFSSKMQKTGFVPQSLRIESPADSAQGLKIASNAGHRFLNERLRSANQNVRELEEERKWRELGLMRTLSKASVNTVMEI